jgi:fumarylacetoacetate (FAA) hydrolase family protein
MKLVLDVEATLPADGTAGTLVGRVWRPDVQGPSVVAVRADGVYDISRSFPTMRDLGETGDPAASVAAVRGEPIGTVASILANTPEIERDQARPWLLAPVDLQAIKAAGVTFAVSLIERVIEEQARGQPQRAAAVRSEVEAAIGGAGLPAGDRAQTAVASKGPVVAIP